MKKKVLKMMMVLTMTAATLAGCGASGAATASTESATKATEAEAEETAEAAYDDLISDIAYIDDGDSNHTLDIYGSQGKTEATKTVIEVHGGGFIGGNKTTNTDHSIVFADAGYVVVTPDYSKVPKDGSFPDVVKELFSIYSWVEEHAEEYNIDTDNIFLSGDSAGGYYVLLSMAIMHDTGLQEYFDVTLPGYAFSGYVTTCPAADIYSMRDDLGAEGPAGHTANTIGEEILLDDDLMGQMDLFNSVDPSVFEGLYMMTTPTDDTTGAMVQKFESYLNDNGIEHEYHSYDGIENELGHVFNISHIDWAESIEANQDEIRYMENLLK